MSEKAERIKELVSILDEAARAYYSESREIMSDHEYDKLYDELSALEAETGIIFSGSPTQKVGYTISSQLEKEKHSQPMLSLNKTKNVDELTLWLGEHEGILSWKLDGLTIALTYNEGLLVKAVTRGDGQTGEVVTEGAKTFENLPLSIPFKGELILRGEAVIQYSDFEKINAEIEDDESKYKNPRNLASGSVRQLDSSVTAGRHVRLYAFALVNVKQISELLKREEQLIFLKEQGFDVVDYKKVDADGIKEAVHNFADTVGSTDLPSDGLVLIYDDIEYGESLGSTSKFPKDGIAFKWEDELAETTLSEIVWNASRTGLINPTAVFDPVEIEGSTVKRAFVHNVSILEELKLGIGDRIKVYKANMIIPQIAENLTKSGPVIPPESCPACGSETEIRVNINIKSLFCTNPACPAKQIKSFVNFVSKKGLNIEGLSESTLEKLIDIGFVREYADLFRLERFRDKIIEMEGFGEKSYDNLLASIDSARHTTRARFLTALGLPQMGEANAKLIAKAFGYDWEQMKTATIDKLVEIDGIGEVMAKAYTDWFADTTNREKLDRLMPFIKFADEKPHSGGALAGKIFVITGSLESWLNRDELKEAIEAAGGKVTGSVSEKTDYLINNDSTSGSAKNKKAKELDVQIITEEQINKMLTDHLSTIPDMNENIIEGLKIPLSECTPEKDVDW